MSSVRRQLFVALLSAALVPAFSAGQARAQCQGSMQRSASTSRQGNAALRTQRQTNSLQSVLSQGGTGLQLNLNGGVSLNGLNLTGQAALQLTARQQAALQMALQQVTLLLNSAQLQGASTSRINQLAALQQQIAAALTAAQQGSAGASLSLSQ
jgi:hypothetical protein